MSTTVTRAEDAADAVAQLRLRVGGDVATPADADWNEARGAWISRPTSGPRSS